MDYQIVKDRARNRVYYTFDGQRSWRPIRFAATLQADLDARTKRDTEAALARAAYDAVMAEIPADYRRRHGALYGGTVSFDGEAGDEIIPPAYGLLRAARWERIAERHEMGSIGLCAGRISDQWILSRYVLPDGRPVYRETADRSYGDDMRETYWLPPDLFALLVGAEIRARKITPGVAREWLAQYRGCVDSELYEAALALDSQVIDIAGDPA